MDIAREAAGRALGGALNRARRDDRAAGGGSDNRRASGDSDAASRGAVGRNSAGSAATVEADGVDADRARLAVLLARVALLGLEGNTGGTTTLAVLDDITARGARVGLFASRAVRHAIVAFDIGVVRGRDLVSVDGHGVVVLAGDRGSLVKLAGDALALEGALGQSIALSKAVAASEAGEVVTAVAGECTRLKARPVIAALLRLRALVVCVRRAGKLVSTDGPTSGRRLLGRKASDDERRRREMHDFPKNAVMIFSQKRVCCV